MSELSVSRKFLYDMDELYTKRRTKAITEEEFSIRRDELFAQEAKSHEAVAPLLITRELEKFEGGIAKTVDQRFQKEEQEENERATRDRLAKIAEQKRIEREEQARQRAIEAENKQRIMEQNAFRSALDDFLDRQEQNTNGWQVWLNWLQIISIILTTATASMAGFEGISRGYVVGFGFAAAALGGILSYLQLQDKIYGNRKALAKLSLECQKYDYCLDDYQDRRTNPEGAYLRFSKQITAIQAELMLYEVELLNPKRQERSLVSREEVQGKQMGEERSIGVTESVGDSKDDPGKEQQ